MAEDTLVDTEGLLELDDLKHKNTRQPREREHVLVLCVASQWESAPPS